MCPVSRITPRPRSRASIKFSRPTYETTCSILSRLSFGNWLTSPSSLPRFRKTPRFILVRSVSLSSGSAHCKILFGAVPEMRKDSVSNASNRETGCDRAFSGKGAQTLEDSRCGQILDACSQPAPPARTDVNALSICHLKCVWHLACHPRLQKMHAY